MRNKLRFFDATLRDGSHAIYHQFSKEKIVEYCKAIDKSGLDVVIVGHGNGLGASSIQVGLSKLSDQQMLFIARGHLQHTKLGAYLIPGFGTIRDSLEPAVDQGVEVFKIGCQCTEADTTRQHIEWLAQRKKEVYGVLMMYHIADTETLLREAQKMQEYGARGVIVMDSAGASTPEMVKRTICILHDRLNIEVGFHAHNNLGLAVGNTYIAIQEGATIIDGTLRGFGAGAGNCPLEVIVALLKKEGMDLSRIDLYTLLDISDGIVSGFGTRSDGLSGLSIVSGMAGVFSGFRGKVELASHQFNVDPRDIFIELGKRQILAGQEDMIIDVAAELQKQNLINRGLSF